MQYIRTNHQAIAAAVFAMLLGASLATAQEVPVIKAHDFTTGSAKVKVTGAFQADEVIPLNGDASLSDGEMTWLQYGVSGAETPNLLVTVSTYEVGLTVARGKRLATAGAEECTGSMKVTGTSVSGRYQCKGMDVGEGGKGIVGKVDFSIDFTAN